MKKWKLIALVTSIVVTVAIAVTLIIIFTSDSNGVSKNYKYPSKIPSISNKDDSFLTLGSRVITNEDVYNAGISSYGLSILIDLIDEKIYDLNVSEEDYNETKKELYASYNGISIDEVTFSEEQTKAFEEQMFLQGFSTAEDIEKAIRLEIVRTKYAKEQLIEDVKNYQPTKENPYYFSDATIQAAIDSIDELKTTAKALYVVFRSSSEAKKLMKSEGFDIDVNNLVHGWKDNEGNAFSKEEVLNLFIMMYNKVNNTSITENDIPEFTASKLSEVSSTISSTIFNSLKDLDKVGIEGSNVSLKECYIANPDGKNYMSSYYYLALRVSSNTPFTVEQYKDILTNGTTDENLKSIYNKVADKLIENTLSDNLINAYLYEKRATLDLKIYDERLDLNFTNAFTNASQYIPNIKDTYEGTKKVSDEYICLFEYNDKEIKITADELFNELSKRYGTIITIQFMNYFIFFNEELSDVYNYETKTKLENYEKAYNKNVYSLFEQLDSNELANYGYPKKYGWDNFVRDYLGLTDELDSVVLFDAYTEAVDKFTKTFFSTTSTNADLIYEKLKEAYIERTITVEEYREFVNSLDKETYENTIVYQICKQFDEYFYLKAGQLNYFFDYNFDGKSDEELDETKHENAKVLLNAIYYLAKNNPKSINLTQHSSSEIVLAEKILKAVQNGTYTLNYRTGENVEKRLSTLVNIFNNSAIDDSIFGSYKNMGLRISLTASSTYTDSSTDGDLAKAFKNIWNQTLFKELLLSDGTYASFEYSKVVNPETTALEAINISENNPYVISEFQKSNNMYSLVFVTSITNTSWYHYYQDEDVNGTAVVREDIMPDITRLETFIRYYELSLIDATELTADQSKEINSIIPIDFEMPFVTNVLGVAYDTLFNDEVADHELNEIRKSYLNDETFKFVDSKYKDLCLQMMALAFEE